MGGGQGSGQQTQKSGGPASTGTTSQHPGMVAAKNSATETGNGHRFRLFTDDTTLLVSSLVDFSRAHSLQMNIINVRPPSLEDAFVRLTEEKSREK